MEFDNPDFAIRACKCSFQEDIILVLYKGKDKIVKIPEGVTMIMDNAFGSKDAPNTDIQEIIMPDTVESIEPNAFAYCQTITSIKFSKKVTSLDISFEGCSSLTELNIPKTVDSITYIKRERSLKKINIPDSLTKVRETAFNFLTARSQDYKKCKLTTGKWYQQETVKILLQNPVYKIIDGFMINTKTKTLLFRTDFCNGGEMHIPDGIEHISSYAFDESRFTSQKNSDFRIKKVTIPSSVKEIDFAAFNFCLSLSEVVYEGKYSDVEIDDFSFSMCIHMDERGTNIIFTESVSEHGKDSKTSNLRLERLVFIHHCFQQGCYMNKNQLQEEMMNYFGLATLGISTITRDLEFLRDRFNAPIEYDYFHKGYYYTNKKFELKL